MGDAIATAPSSAGAPGGPSASTSATNVLRAASLVGAFAGLWTAFGDFGATWLWLPLWRDRGGLLVRLLASLVPVGALCAVVLAGVGLATLRWAAQKPEHTLRRLPLPLVVASLPALRLLAVKLCSGGMMSRLRFHDALEWALTLVMPALLYLAIFFAAHVARALVAGRISARASAAVLLGASFLLGKINQTVLPNLYDYLHAALAVLTWSVAALGVAALAFVPRLTSYRAWLERPRVAHVAWGVLAVAFAVNVLTLDSNLNVRVAMFDARSPASRALFAALDPVLARVMGRDAERHGKKGLYRGAMDTTGMPTQEGAHILLITVDALRADHLGAYGYARPVSPRIDALAESSALFERVYAQAPHSSYSLSSLHTSEYVHEVVELGRPLPEHTLATTLKAAGYHTAAFFTDGIFHTEGTKLGPYRDQAFGFALFDHTNRESEDQTTRVLQEIDRIKGLGEPKSFLWVHYFDVHEPYQETTFGTGEMERYDSEILHVDRELARLVHEVDARFDREVIVAITADHGEEFREHGGVYHGSTLYEEQVRVPLIVRAAALGKRRVTAPVESIDIGPTLLGLASVEIPASMRGRDLRPLALGRVSDPGPVFSAVLTKRMAVRWPLKLVADLRFGLFELYDLAADPKERKNLARSEPKKLTDMRDLVYAWLDSIEAPPQRAKASAGGQIAASAGPRQQTHTDVIAPEDEWTRALRWGRLGDRRAVEPMSRLLLDTGAPVAMRIEAGQILAKLADTTCAPALVQGMHTTPGEVAAEAAIALGRMYDERARRALERLVHTEDPYVRARAAVSLGRLRDRSAVPALIDALWVAPTQYEREEAVRWLGRLRDRRAVEPLLSIIPEFNLRYLVAVALGQIGDRRAYDALADMLEWEHHTNIRDEVVRGLGTLADARAIEALVRVLETEPGLKNTSESLVRLGALERGYLGGLDLSPQAKGAARFERCTMGPVFHDWDYLGRTTCATRGPEVQLELPLPKAHARWQAGAELIVRARRMDAPEPVEVVLGAGQTLGTLRIDGNWNEQRVAIDPSLVRARASLPITVHAAVDGARIELDHVLLVPRTEALLADQADAKPAADAQRIP